VSTSARISCGGMSIARSGSPEQVARGQGGGAPRNTRAEIIYELNMYEIYEIN
jgi:hypothetical protein